MPEKLEGRGGGLTYLDLTDQAGRHGDQGKGKEELNILAIVPNGR